MKLKNHGLTLSLSKGFTLIELLVVIAIIGLLASVVLASLNTARMKGRDARRLSDIKQLQLALELYYDANPAAGYPTTLAPLASNYIAQIPNDPSNNAAYSYAALATGSSATYCNSYHLGGSLEDTNSSAKSSDADAAASTSLCTGSGSDFSGQDTAACKTGDVGVWCYDVKP